MTSYVGVQISDGLQHQFTQVELRGLKTKFVSLKGDNDKLSISELPNLMKKLKAFNSCTRDEIAKIINEDYQNPTDQIDFEGFLRAYLDLQGRVPANSRDAKSDSAFLKAATTTLLHTISESEKASYVAHINSYLSDDPFLSQFLPLDPATNDLFSLAKDGVLLCKLINVAVPNTIDERAINTKKALNPWERNENHTLCLNSAKAIGCTVVNIGTQDLVEGRPHLVLGLISQIIKIQLLADLNLKKTPQLVELVNDNSDVDELLGLAPEKVLLKWMNHHLKHAGYEKTVTNFSSDLKDGKAYEHLLNVLAPEYQESTKATEGSIERARRVLQHAERINCKRYLKAEDIVEGSHNLNLAFVAQIFHQRNGLSVDNKKRVAYVGDDVETSREERCYRLWINSLGIASYVNNVFEDVRNGWVLLEVLEKVFPGSVKWKQATKPPINTPFRKVENCNQVIRIGREMKFSLVNLGGNDIVQGNKKLILAYLWQLMRFNMLQLLKALRTHSHRDLTDSDILRWSNETVKRSGRLSHIGNFKDKSLSTGIFFLELLSAVERRVVNWTIVTKGETEEEKRLNATYIISVARKLGCAVFLLPDDIMEVNPKMMLILAASIMYKSMVKAAEEGDTSSFSPLNGSSCSGMSTPTASPAPSVNGDDDTCSFNGENGSPRLHDAIPDPTVAVLFA